MWQKLRSNPKEPQEPVRSNVEIPEVKLRKLGFNASSVPIVHVVNPTPSSQHVDNDLAARTGDQTQTVITSKAAELQAPWLSS